jgi:hypothetical protein
MSNVVVGNAYEDRNERHWLLGHFMEESTGLRKDNRIEVMWSSRKAGDTKEGWTKSTKATTLCILIKGKFSNTFPGVGECILEKEGDYLIYGPETPHSWYAYEDSLLITIRWPSEPGHIVEVPKPE